MSAPSALAAIFVPIGLIGFALAWGSARRGRLPESTEVAVDAVRKTALRQLLAGWKLQIGSLVALACLAAFGGLSRGNGWLLPFGIVPIASALAIVATWFGASAVLREASRQLVGFRSGTTASDLARTTLGVMLVAQALGALLGLGLGALDGTYGLRLGDWAATSIALGAVFVALAAATLEPLTLGQAQGGEASPANLGGAAALSLIRPMRSLIVIFGLSTIAFDRFSRQLSSTDPARAETSTYLLLVLAGSALATLFGGLSVRSEEQEDVAHAFRRGIRSSLAILAACIWLARGQGDAPIRSHTQLWALGLFAIGMLAFFSHAFRRLPSLLSANSPAERLTRGARVPLVVGVGFLVTQTFAPDLNAASIFFAVVLGAAPIALLSVIATDCRRGASHLAWLVLHPSAVQGAVEDESLESLPPVEFWLFGACLMTMTGPALDIERVPASALGAMVLLGFLAVTLALVLHRRALEEPIRESGRIVSGENGGGPLPLTRPVELGAKAVTRAGVPLIAFLGGSATLTLITQSTLLPATLSASVTLGLWIGSLALGVGAAGYFSGEPLSTRGSLGPLALTLSLTLGTLLMSVQSIVL